MTIKVVDKSFDTLYHGNGKMFWKVRDSFAHTYMQFIGK